MVIGCGVFAGLPGGVVLTGFVQQLRHLGMGRANVSVDTRAVGALFRYL